MYSKVIELEFCTVSLRNDGILEHRFEWNTHYVVEGNHIEEIAESLRYLSEGEKKPILSIAGQYGSMTVEARNTDINKSSEYTLALALVIKELAQRLLSNFYFKIKKIDYPIKSFKTEEEANEWLREQVNLRKKVG